MTPDHEAREAAAAALHDRQWRNSEYHPRWGEGSHGLTQSGHSNEVRDDANAAIDAYNAKLREGVSDEREALAVILHNADCGCDDGLDTDDGYWRQAEAIFAAGFTRRPMPSREQVARTLSRCKTFEPDVCDGCARRLREADAVLALFEKGVEG